VIRAARTIWDCGTRSPNGRTSGCAFIRTVVYNYRGIGASDGSLDGITLVDYGNDVWAIAAKCDGSISAEARHGIAERARKPNRHDFHP
jgi:hypothetical protein